MQRWTRKRSNNQQFRSINKGGEDDTEDSQSDCRAILTLWEPYTSMCVWTYLTKFIFVSHLTSHIFYTSGVFRVWVSIHQYVIIWQDDKTKVRSVQPHMGYEYMYIHIHRVHLYIWALWYGRGCRFLSVWYATWPSEWTMNGAIFILYEWKQWCIYIILHRDIILMIHIEYAYNIDLSSIRSISR